MDLDRIAAAYWARYEDTGRTDDHSGEAVDQAIRTGGRSAVELIAMLAAAAPGEQALAYLGAGPLEDLLRVHGAAVVDAVDELARRDARFRFALRCAWFETCLPPDVTARLRRHGNPP